MRKRFTAAVLVLSILLSLAVSGCSGRKTEGGLIFASVSSMSDKKYITDSLWYDDVKDGYACIVTADAPADIVIPDEYKGHPVKLLMSELSSSDQVRFNSITIGSNVAVIYGFAGYGVNCFENVKELVMPDSLRRIYSSFCNCKSLEKLVLPEGLYQIDGSFDNMDSLKEFTIPTTVWRVMSSFSDMDGVTIYVPGDTQIMECFHDSGKVSVIIDDESQLETVGYSFMPDIKDIGAQSGFRIGTRELFAYSDMVDEDKVFEQGKSHFCESFDPSKEIIPEDAFKFAKFLEAPVVTVETCPDVTFDEYTSMDRNVLFEETEPVYMSIANMASYSADNYIRPDMSSPPSVYIVAEKMKGQAVAYLVNGVGKNYYHMAYRFSVWDIETDQLICWFVTDEGTEADRNPATFVEGEYTFLYDHGMRPTVQALVHKYFLLEE